MKLSYTFNPDGTIRNVEFTGCTGAEPVGTVKEALNVLRLDNPNSDFCELVKRGDYDAVSDEEYFQALATVKCLDRLFRYPDAPEDAFPRREMNVLILLANALTRVVEQDVELRRYRKEEKGL